MGLFTAIVGTQISASWDATTKQITLDVSTNGQPVFLGGIHIDPARIGAGLVLSVGGVAVLLKPEAGGIAWQLTVDGNTAKSGTVAIP